MKIVIKLKDMVKSADKDFIVAVQNNPSRVYKNKKKYTRKSKHKPKYD